MPGHVDALRILLRNLIDNAIKYTPAGGTVDVSVSRAEGDDALVLAVEDSGPGIAPEDRAQVLGRFHRATQADAQGRPIAGSGLGLSIVQTIARMHGAVVELGSSARLGGLSVSVRLPQQPAAAERAGGGA